VRVAMLAAGRDPFDLAAEGEDAVAAALAGAADWPDFVVALARREHPGDDVGAQLAAIREAGPLLSAVPEELERTLWRRRLAERLGIPAAAVDMKWRPAAPAEGPRVTAEHNLLRILIQYPSAAAECLAEMLPEDVADEQVRRVLRVVTKLAKGGPFSVVELLDELDEADGGMVTRLAMSEAKEENAALAARLAVKAVKRRAFARRSREVREHLAACNGEYDEAAPTLKELVEEKRRHLKGETGS